MPNKLVKNHVANLRQTLCSRLLYTVVPAPYGQDTLNDLLLAWVNDLNGLSEHGLTVPKLNWLISPIQIYTCSYCFLRVASLFLSHVCVWYQPVISTFRPGTLEGTSSEVPLCRDIHQRRLAIFAISMRFSQWLQLQRQMSPMSSWRPLKSINFDVKFYMLI